MLKIQTPEGTTECSHEGIPYLLDEARQIEVPEDVAPFFLRLPGFREVIPPTPAQRTKRAASTEEA